MRSKPQIPDGMSDPSVPLTLEFFANPRYPPRTSSATSASGPAAVSREERPENSSTAAGKEASILTGLPDLPNDGVKDVAAN